MKSGCLLGNKAGLFTHPTLNSILSINEVDRIFLNKINIVLRENNTAQLVSMAQSMRVNFVVKAAHVSKDFEEFCLLDDQLKKHWEQLWCIYGAILSRDLLEQPVLFFTHPAIPAFNLVRGAFFYDLSKQTNKKMARDFSYSEVEYLQQAIKYRSVHAIQRYNQYLYAKINSNHLSNDEIKAHFNEIIANIETVTPHYGAYSYMMLAEAYARYSQWFFNIGEAQHYQQEADMLNRSCLQSIQFAENCLSESKEAIHNASCGLGLGSSNTLGIYSPTQAKEVFNQQMRTLTLTGGCKR